VTSGILLDHNATTPVDPQVLDAMLPWLRGSCGNPSSDHPAGRAARAAVERARAEVGALIGAEPDEIVFTSGGTEADDLAIRGLVSDRPAIVTTAIEHPAVSQACDATGREVRRVAPGPDGRVTADALRERIDEATALVTVMLANNETGVLQPVAEAASAARRAGAASHTDAAQAVGKIPVDVRALDVDLLTFAGHKLYAPKGVGALFVRRGTPLSPRVVGGGQERGLRAGTENVPGVVALGEACRIAGLRLADDAARIALLRDRLEAGLVALVPGLRVTGRGAMRLPNTLHVRFPGTLGADVLARAPIVLASTGSACHADGVRPSAVLLAMGLDPDDARGAVRLSLGRATTAEDIEAAALALARAAHA
jgi:cysteine desulfurase